MVQYQRLQSETEPFAFWWTDVPIFRLDEQVGYQYIPNQQIRLTLTDHLDANVFATDMILNNVGNVSRFDDDLTKPEGEFRIALIGDSFTASNFNPNPWGDQLEVLLNRDEALKDQLGVTDFNVMNFGREAIGVGQFDDIYLHSVAPFEPDLVVGSFISYDIQRRFVWRDTVTLVTETRAYDLVLSCASLPVSIENLDCEFGIVLILDANQAQDENFLTQMRQDIYQADLNRRPWGHVYPELLAHLLGETIGLQSNLQRGSQQNRLVYSDDRTAIAESEAALDHLSEQAHQTLIVHIPMFYEIEGGINPLATSLMGQTDLPIIAMLDHLPIEDDAEMMRGWYNLPWDNHFSDEGAAVFAQAIYQKLKEQLGS